MSTPQTTSRLDRDFVERLANEISLDAGFVLDWIVENFAPEDVYTVDQLEEWAIDHGFVKEGE